MSLTSHQLEMRRTRVTATDLWKILSGNGYAVWEQKTTGKSAFTGDEDFIWIGNAFEPLCGDHYVRSQLKRGRQIRLLRTEVPTPTGREGVTLEHPNGWFCGTPDFLVAAMDCPLDMVKGLDDVYRLRDSGHLSRGLEIKTGAAFAETHLEDEDQWGEGNQTGMRRVATFLVESQCMDGTTARELARTLCHQFEIGKRFTPETVEAAEDEYDEDTNNIPRQYLCQVHGYLALTGLPQWDLHRMRFGFGGLDFPTYTVKRDESLEGSLLQTADKFRVDHMLTGKPPAPKKLEQIQDEVFRLFPRDNGVMRSATHAELQLLELYRDMVIDAKNAELRKEFIQAVVTATIGNDKGIDGGKPKMGGLGNVSWGLQQGQKSVNVDAALASLADRFMSADKPTFAQLESWIDEAKNGATKQHEAFRKISRPPSWTKGLETIVRQELIDAGKLPANVGLLKEGDEE